MNKYKKINLVLLVISLALATFTYLYWQSVCAQGVCSYEMRNNALRPLMQMGIVLGIYSVFFLFLPVHYFESWLKRVFSWAFPLSFILVLGTGNSGSVMSVSRAEVVILTGVFFGVITLVFVLLRWWKLKKAGVPK